MARPDVFALKNSDLNAFLFADVGTELNGSALTVLSVLARLGEDPWAEAARWARLPKAAAIDCLVQCISRMPLSRQALTDVRTTASQLAVLLPRQGQATAAGSTSRLGTVRIPKWLPLAMIGFSLAAGLAFNVILAPRPTADVAPMPTQTTEGTR